MMEKGWQTGVRHKCQTKILQKDRTMKFITNPSLYSLARRAFLALGLSGALLAGVSKSGAQTRVFNEDWETDHSFDNTYVTNYTTGGANLAVVYFDYSTVGIP